MHYTSTTIYDLLEGELFHAMSELESRQPTVETNQLLRLTREQAETRLSANLNFDSCDVSDLNLAGLRLTGRSFRGADVRGLLLHNPETSATDIRNTHWTNALVASFGAETHFRGVNAEGAQFGYTETLHERRAKNDIYTKETGKPPIDTMSNAYFGFSARGANCQRSSWWNIDFGGGVDGYEARFVETKLAKAMFKGCDLSGIDLSSAEIDHLVIKDPVSLDGLTIGIHQIDTLARSIIFSDTAQAAEWRDELAAKGEALALVDYFAIQLLSL